MVLDQQRQRLDWWLVPLAKAFRHIHPNVFTWLSLVAAFAAGYAFYRSGPEALGWLGLGVGMVWLNGTLDVLDGKVAKITGKTSLKGDYLDHAIDRFSDVLFLGGLTLSGWVPVELGLVALTFTLLTSYLGTQAQAVGMGRNYGGLLGRADRLMLLLLVPIVQIILGGDFVVPRIEQNLLVLMFGYFALGGIISTIQRFTSGLKQFDANGNLK